MNVEIINNQLELEVGDIVIYPSGAGLRTARIEKKPTLRDSTPNSFKSTRCKVSVVEQSREYKNTNGKVFTINWSEQKFNLKEFNKIKYINFRNDSKLLKVIDNVF